MSNVIKITYACYNGTVAMVDETMSLVFGVTDVMNLKDDGAVK